MNPFLPIAALILFCLPGCKNAENTHSLFAKNSEPENRQIDFDSFQSRADEAQLYCEENKLNTDFFLLVDLKRHSGLKRFYIWDFKKDTLAHSFLVSHGCGKNRWAMDDSKDAAQVSNTDGSHLSSVGKYVISARGYSNWGINVNYLMHGNDATNNNALMRQIVLHSWEKVSDEEVYPAGTPEGWGCPALSNTSMRIVDEKLRKANGKVLLWVVK